MRLEKERRMNTLMNPVSDYYANYKFRSDVLVVECASYEEVLSKASSVKASCILLNKTKTVLKDKRVDVNLTFPTGVDVMLVLNVELRGQSTLKLSGKNYGVSNINFIDGDSSWKTTNFIVDIVGEFLRLVNFSMVNVKVGVSDLDYVCVRTSAKNFSMYNSRLNGKTNNGVFFRMDFPLNGYVKCCVFENFGKVSAANGGEMIRLATSAYEKNDANCVIDQCYFSRCLGDPEVVSVKCSLNTIKNCIFENNDSCKLVLRHAHKIKVSNCYFSGSAMRVYGTNHTIEKVQLVNEANILLDNKKGSSYVVATNVKVNEVYFDNVKSPVTNNGKNCTVTNVTKGLKILKKDLLSAIEDVDPTPIPPVDPIDPIDPDPIDPIEPKIIMIPESVDGTKIYKLNPALTEVQVEEILSQFALKIDE